MKKVVLILVALVATVTMTNAQGFKKADKFVEGTASYSKTTDVEATYSIKPTVGYFVTDRVAIGLFGEAGKDAAAKNLEVGAFARCYFASIGKSLKVFSQLDVSNFTETDNVTDVKTSSFHANLGIGGNYFVGKRIAITANVANLISFESADSKSTTTIGFDGVSNPFTTAKFGIIYKF